MRVADAHPGTRRTSRPAPAPLVRSRASGTRYAAAPMSSLSRHERIRRLQRLPRRLAARLGGVRGPFDTPQAQALAAELRAAFAVYRTDRLVGIDPATFEADLRAREGVVDAAVEGYDTATLERQRDLSIRFTWGHTHDFGSFAVQGEMRERHLELMANFLSIFDLPRTHVRDRDVLDVGCWTGGTTLLLAALGARVVAIEEVRKYAATAQFLATSFGLAPRVQVQARSVYACVTDDLRERFDTVYFPGVIYHLSDPLLALRILFNALRVGGDILVEIGRHRRGRSHLPVRRQPGGDERPPRDPEPGRLELVHAVALRARPDDARGRLRRRDLDVARRLGSRLRPRPQDGPDADLPRRVVGARYPVVRDPNRARGVRPSRSGSSTAFRSGAPSTQDSARCSPPFPCC